MENLLGKEVLKYQEHTFVEMCRGTNWTEAWSSYFYYNDDWLFMEELDNLTIGCTNILLIIIYSKINVLLGDIFWNLSVDQKLTLIMVDFKWDFRTYIE